LSLSGLFSILQPNGRQLDAKVRVKFTLEAYFGGRFTYFGD
jgi:hypothetical protein